MGFFRNAAGVFATSLASLPIGIATSVMLARWLSMQDRGLYSVAVSFSGLAALLVQLGWPSASIYRLRRIRSQPAQVASAAIAATVAMSLLLVVVSLAFQQSITRHFLDGAPPRILYLILAVVPFQILATLFSGVARGIDRFAVQNAFQIGLSGVTLATTAGALLAGNATLEEVLLALLASQAVVTLAFVGAVLRHTGVSIRVSATEIRESLRFGFKNYLASLSGQMHERVDVLLLAYLLGDPEQIAIYAVAVGMIQRLKVLPEAIGTALLPQLAGLPEPDAARFSTYVCRHSFSWSLLIALALAACAPFLITLLYGAQYRPATTPFLILLPGMLLLTVYRVLARYFAAIDRQQANIWTQALSLVANVVLNILWIPSYGIVGSAFASLVSYGLATALIVVVFGSTTRSGLREILIWQAGDLDPYRRRLSALMRRLRKAR